MYKPTPEVVKEAFNRLNSKGGLEKMDIKTLGTSLGGSPDFLLSLMLLGITGEIMGTLFGVHVGYELARVEAEFDAKQAKDAENPTPAEQEKEADNVPA